MKVINDIETLNNNLKVLINEGIYHDNIIIEEQIILDSIDAKIYETKNKILELQKREISK